MKVGIMLLVNSIKVDSRTSKVQTTLDSLMKVLSQLP